jgi:hypothetical protein
VKEEPELLVKFDNGIQVWTLVDNAFVDSKEDLLKYFEFNCLNDTAMVTSTMKRVKQHEDDLEREKKEKNDDKLFYNPEDNSMTCKHDQWEMEMGYKAEGNSEYCSEKQDMATFECVVCSAKFMSVGHTVDGHTFKPTNNKPAYVCINCLKGCKQAACYKCFHKK